MKRSLYLTVSGWAVALAALINVWVAVAVFAVVIGLAFLLEYAIFKTKDVKTTMFAIGGAFISAIVYGLSFV